MNLLLVAATVFEIRPLLERLTCIDDKGLQLSAYQYHDISIDILITGVGMVPTAYHLGRQLTLKQYDLAINGGIAGTFTPSIPIGSVVNVVEDCVPELGAEDGDEFLSVFALGLTDPDAPPYKRGRLIIDPEYDACGFHLESIKDLPRVKAITSNTVRGNRSSINRIQSIADADIETMEGAAFFYACLSAGVPCVQIRSVSNLVEERDKSRWNLDLALNNLNACLSGILKSLATLD